MQGTRKKSKKKIIIISILGVIVLGIGIVGLIYLQTNNKVAATSSLKYQAYQVKSGNLEVSVDNSGTLSLANVESIKADIPYTIDAWSVEAGDSVKSGDTIATLDTSSIRSYITDLQTQINDLDTQIASVDPSAITTISSPVQGRVKLLKAESNNLVQKLMQDNGYLCVISTDGNMRVAFTPPEDTVAAVGDTIQLTFEDGTVKDAVIVSQNDQGQFVALMSGDTYDVGTKVALSKDDGTNLGDSALEINAPVPISATSGTIDSVYISENSYVYVGTSLFYLKNTSISDNLADAISQRTEVGNDLITANKLLEQPILTAPKDGIISAITLIAGAPGQDNVEVYQLADTQKFYIQVDVEESDIGKVSIGQASTVKIEALNNESINGTVKSISQLGTTSNSVTTYAVKILLDDTDGLMSGMSADSTIVIDKAENALYVPVGAIQTINNKKYVLVSDSTTATTSGNQVTAGDDTQGSFAIPSDFPKDGNMPDRANMPNGGNMPDRANMPNGGAMPNFNNDASGQGNNGSNQGGSIGNTLLTESEAQGTLVEVTLGLVNDSYAQILTGLTEGQTVLVPTYSSSNTGNMSFGGSFPGGMTGGGLFQGGDFGSGGAPVRQGNADSANRTAQS